MGDPTFAHVQTDPLSLTNGDLAALLGGMTDADVLRTLIMAEVAQIRAGAERESRTLRNVWYECVKPALSRVGLLTKTTRGGKLVDWDGLTSKYLAELVRAELTSYEELRIIDGSRQRRPAWPVARAIAQVELVGADFPWVILFTEKDTIWQAVQALAALYGVSAISGGGQPSKACSHEMTRRILTSEQYREGPGGLVVLTLTDYDPSGYDIAAAQVTQIQEAAAGRCEVRTERLGLEPAQLTPAERQAKAYTPPRGAQFRRWYKETGGVDGQPLGLELDALPLSRLRAIFAEGIERYIDLDARRFDLQWAFVELLAWEVLSPHVEDLKAQLWAAVEDVGLWDRVLATEIPGNLFRQAAAAGWDRIDPLATTYNGRPLFDCKGEILDAMAEVWEG